MAPVTDQMIYLVILAHKGGPYLSEQNVSDLGRSTVVADIADGQHEGVAQVLECNPVEGTCRDATGDIATEVSAIWADAGEPLSPWQIDFIETFCGLAAAQCFKRAA